jgi:uncharacterized protein
MKNLFLILTLFVMGIAAVAAEPTFPPYTGFVNDSAGVLDRATLQKIEEVSRRLQQKTSAQLAIAIVKTVAPLDSKTYVVKLFEKWKPGEKGKDNGILLLLALEEKRLEIEVGYGIEAILNDAQAGEILDRYVVPFFKQGRMGDGLYNGALAIADRISRPSEVEPAKAREKLPWSKWLLPAMIIAITLLVILSIFFSGVASGLMGLIVGAVIGLSFAGLVGAVIGALVGFVLSFTRLPGGFTGGGFSGGGWGGGFGGGGGSFSFGGGGSGGGGAGRSW